MLMTTLSLGYAGWVGIRAGTDFWGRDKHRSSAGTLKQVPSLRSLITIPPCYSGSYKSEVPLGCIRETT
jgi:hypothetical protein